MSARKLPAPALAGNRELAVKARTHARMSPPGSIERRAWGCAAVALTETCTVAGAERCLGSIREPEIRAAALERLRQLTGQDGQ